MKKALLNYRYYVLLAILCITILGVFSVPDDDLPLKIWMILFIILKIIGFGAGYVLYRLITYWQSKNLMPELTKMTAEE